MTIIHAVRTSIVHADAIGIAAGARHAVVIRTGGTVWSVGNNDNGQLGNDESGYGRRTADRDVYTQAKDSTGNFITGQ